MKAIYAYGATGMALFAGAIFGTIMDLHPLNKDLRATGWIFLTTVLVLVVVLLAVGTAHGK